MKTLKTALLGASFLIGASAMASAADVYQREGSYKDAGPVEYAPGISWSGFYFGLNAGVNFSEVEFDNGFEEDENEFIAGLHVGYNWQKHGPWVFGVEGDVSFADGLDYLASIRGRIGFAMGSTMLYGTGGWAFGEFEDSDGEDFDGWVAGLGLEHKFTQNVSAGVEALYYDFGDNFDNVEDVDSWTVRARLTYHLGGGYSDALK